MRRLLIACTVIMGLAAPSWAAGLLIPTEKKLPPLAMLNHQVTVNIEDQVAITRVEQVFRNHTDRQLEATYVFPVPKGASVRKFSMWVAGKEVTGELVEADKAKKIYQEIVSRTKDPGILEYIGNNLLQLRVFPIEPKSDQKIALSFTSIAPTENGMVEYIYPLKTNAKAAATTLEKFSVQVNLVSQHPITNIYSPSHGITTQRPSDKKATIGFEKDQALLDADFQLYYTLGNKDVGVTALTHRPSVGQDGYFLMLINPRAELSKEQQIPRDMVFVLDTSGSMRGKRMTQAKSALKFCLSSLEKTDRFTILNFATTVNKYTNALQTATEDNVALAKKWVDNLEATGGTAINDALLSGLTMRPEKTEGRTFNMVFFTDGRPTIGETNFEKIMQNVAKNNNANTRIFTFGVGDDVNASYLDQLSEQSRALSTYVRETEDIEVKVSGLYSKISNPVLTSLKLVVSGDVTINEVYPPQLPDLFHGSQVVVLGRYNGKGHAAVKLTGQVGMAAKEFVYELNFPEKTAEEKPFVEDLWARRKVGYLLDQIRLNGEKKEMVDEVIALAKRYGITTQYTSYLVVPDAPVPVAGGFRPQPGRPDVRFHINAPGGAAPGLNRGPNEKPLPVSDFIKGAQKKKGEGAVSRQNNAIEELDKVTAGDAKDDRQLKSLQEAKARFYNYQQAGKELRGGNLANVQGGKLGVDLSCEANNLRNQTQMTQNAQRRYGNRNALEVGGVWIDEAYEASMKTVAVKAMSEAYFRILDKQPTMRDIFRIGNHLVWVSPSGTALVIDADNGVDTLEDAAIDALFVAAKKE